jgi:hypothetical protein
MYTREYQNINLYFSSLQLYIKEYILTWDLQLVLKHVSARYNNNSRPTTTLLVKNQNNTRLIGYIKKDAIRIIIVVDHVAILNFDPQIIILIKDIINSEVRLPAWRNIMFMKSQTISLLDIYPKRNNKHILSFNNIRKRKFYLYILILFLLNSKVSKDYRNKTS